MATAARCGNVLMYIKMITKVRLGMHLGRKCQECHFFHEPDRAKNTIIALFNIYIARLLC